MIQTLFCDIGNVLLFFDRSKGYNNVASAFGIETNSLISFIETEDIHSQFETGTLSTAGLYEILCSRGTIQPSIESFAFAWSDIFSPNEALFPIIEELKSRGVQLVLLSNISELHWAWVSDTFSIIDQFHAATLSYEVGAMKPSHKIYQDALQKASCSPAECLYIDDIPEYTEAAKELGIDAITYTNMADLEKEFSLRDL